MTPEAQRIAIAELRGWKRCTPYQDIGDMTPRWYWNGGYYGEFQLPDVDLNAMHEAERDGLDDDSMSPHGRVVYLKHLEFICGCVEGMVRATAAQRAEALLRTLGLWRSELGAEDIPQMWNQQ